jgi:hypothetical protein
MSEVNGKDRKEIESSCAAGESEEVRYYRVIVGVL